MKETRVRSLGLEDPLEKGKATPLQYSGLKSSMDCIVPGVAKSRTWLSDFHVSLSLDSDIWINRQVSTFKDLEEKMDLMSEKMVNLNRKMQTIKKNQMEISEFKLIISDMKILKKLKIRNCRELVNL